MTYRGLTWDHPRGRDALVEVARRVNASRGTPLIEWEVQPLEEFESAPITELAGRYDLIVIDHPHIGEAVVEGCLRPLEEFFQPEQIAAWAKLTVGPSLRSYAWEGRHWALPLDVATQVMARRPDRVPQAPANWDSVEALAGQVPVALSLGGPHAFLNLISMAAGLGAVVGGPDMLPDAVARPALDRLARLAGTAPPGSAALNPIELLEAMVRSDQIALVPLVFGYVTYARACPVQSCVAFSDTITGPGGRGGVLGGTGIAFSHRCDPDPDLLNHVSWLLSAEVQTQLFPRHNGQPSLRAAWRSRGVNAVWGDFYTATLKTAETALLRPRFDGFPAFTNRASARLRKGFADGDDASSILADLRTLWHDARAQARGSLDDERD